MRTNEGAPHENAGHGINGGLKTAELGACQGCHHKSKLRIRKNFETNPEILNWFALQEQKGKYNTWHDDQLTYLEIFMMEFSQLIEFGDGVACDTGYCRMD